MGGTGTGTTSTVVTAATVDGHVDDSQNNMLSNVNESTCIPTIVNETQAIITSANLQQQHQQSQKQQQGNSIISDTITSSNDTINHNTILAVDDIVNNTKISQICNNMENGTLPMQTMTNTVAPSTTTTTTNFNGMVTTVTSTPLKCGVITANVNAPVNMTTMEIHDIDRLFLNTSTIVDTTNQQKQQQPPQ